MHRQLRTLTSSCMIPRGNAQTKGPIGPSLKRANVVYAQGITTAVLLGVPILYLCNSSEELTVTEPE